MLTFEYLEYGKCHKKYISWCDIILQQLDVGYHSQFPAILTYKCALVPDSLKLLMYTAIRSSVTQPSISAVFALPHCISIIYIVLLQVCLWFAHGLFAAWAIPWKQCDSVVQQSTGAALWAVGENNCPIRPIPDSLWTVYQFQSLDTANLSSATSRTVLAEATVVHVHLCPQRPAPSGWCDGKDHLSIWQHFENGLD